MRQFLLYLLFYPINPILASRRPTRTFLQTDDDDQNTEELERSRQAHEDSDKYCAKYKSNFASYCVGEHGAELEGVLHVFCYNYKNTCSIAEGGKGIFPLPKPLVESATVQQKHTTSPEDDDKFPEPIDLAESEKKHGKKEPETGAQTPFIESARVQQKHAPKPDDDEAFPEPIDLAEAGKKHESEKYKKKQPETEAQTPFIESTRIQQKQTPKPDDDQEFPEPLGSAESEPKHEPGMNPQTEIPDEIKKGEDGASVPKGRKLKPYCEKYMKEYKNECSDGFIPEDFCSSFKKNCFDDGENVKEEDEKEDRTAEGEGASHQEQVSTYCRQYIENYHYFCVGDEIQEEHEKFCRSYTNNCPDEKVHLKESGTFLGSEADRHGLKSQSESTTFKGEKKDYCARFSVNYEFYCKRPPSNPFEGKQPTGITDDFPDVENPTTSVTKKKRRRKGGKRGRVKRRACTPDCDQKIFRHCTVECKCDYSYPYVQKFCNPPPLPLFLNTCRLWYNGCPKYEQYHYASQFVYSKAEKGKVIEGPKTASFNLLSPSGETLQTKIPQRRLSKRSSGVGDGWVDWGYTKEEEEELVIPPPVPKRSIANDDVVEDKVPKLPDSQRKSDVPVSNIPVVPADSVFSNALAQYNTLTDQRGILHRPRTKSPFTKPGLWEANPDDPHNRDHANKYYYHPESVNVDWLSGQLAWGAHWAVPAAGVGGTQGFSTVHFPTVGTFFNIPDDYD